MPNGSLIADGLIGRSSIRIEDAEDAFGTEGDVIEAGGDVLALGSTLTHYAGDKWVLSATLSSTGDIIRRKQYFKGRDTCFPNGKPRSMNTPPRERRIISPQQGQVDLRGRVQVDRFPGRQPGHAGYPEGLRFRGGHGGDALPGRVGPGGGEVHPPSSQLDTHKEALYASVNFSAAKRLFLALGPAGRGPGNRAQSSE